jgi:hypothetical protein
MQKRPEGWRFISGARECVTKPCAKILSIILKFLQTNMEKYCKAIERTRGINCYWSIKNNRKPIQMAYNFEGDNCVQAGDFSSLYTKLPLDIVKKCVHDVIDRLMGKYGDRVKVAYKTAHWTKETGKNTYCAKDIKNMLHFILNFAVVQFAGIPFKQILGIPQGGNASPALADLTLGELEYKFLSNPINEALAKRLEYTSRYIDDAMNYGVPNFIDICQTLIYPDVLRINDTSESMTLCTYLDTRIDLSNGVNVAVYNKTTVFNFEVIRYIEKSSNVCCKLAGTVLYTQFHRAACICSNVQNFKIKCCELKNDFAKKSQHKKEAKLKFIEFCNKYAALVARFHILNKKDACKFWQNLKT